MILIADCGSTKTDWCLCEKGEVKARVFTSGMNAVMLTEEEMRQRIATELLPQLEGYSPDAVFFYGAGCLAPEICGNVARALGDNLSSAVTIDVHSDLLASARALCGHQPGIACIMGTGSNSCYYDGKTICDNVSPLGYILGDEGSGAVLGKLLVGDVLKRQLPEALCEKFLRQYELDRLTIITRVYKEPAANRFLASVSPFLLENINEPSIRAIVMSSFTAFFMRNVMNYAEAKTLPVSFVGSIAWHYREILTEAAEACGLKTGIILKSPMDGLVAFHTEAGAGC